MKEAEPMHTEISKTRQKIFLAVKVREVGRREEVFKPI